MTLENTEEEGIIKGSPISMIIIGFYLFIKYTQLISTANL